MLNEKRSLNLGDSLYTKGDRQLYDYSRTYLVDYVWKRMEYKIGNHRVVWGDFLEVMTSEQGFKGQTGVSQMINWLKYVHGRGKTSKYSLK